MMGLMRNTIKYHEDFITPRDFPYELMELFTIRTKLAKFPDDPRFGLVVTKRAFRHAVQRNRAKRLLRDWIAFNEKYMCPDLDYVFYARTEILGDNVTREMGRKMMAHALKSIYNRNKFRKNGYQKKPKE